MYFQTGQVIFVPEWAKGEMLRCRERIRWIRERETEQRGRRIWKIRPDLPVAELGTPARPGNAGDVTFDETMG
jgi:hypothetical protein